MSFWPRSAGRATLQAMSRRASPSDCWRSVLQHGQQLSLLRGSDHDREGATGVQGARLVEVRKIVALLAAKLP
eukprot:1842955-Prymnesium_polylepis.1